MTQSFLLQCTLVVEGQTIEGKEMVFVGFPRSPREKWGNEQVRDASVFDTEDLSESLFC